MQTINEWLGSKGIEHKNVLVANLITVGYTPSQKDACCIGAVLGRLTSDERELVMVGGASKAQIDELSKISGIDWSTYECLEVPPARAQRKVIDFIQQNQQMMILSYSLQRFFLPWVTSTAWLHGMLDYPLVDFADIVYSLDNGTMSNMFRADSVAQLQDWMHGGKPGNAKGYGIEALLGRYGQAVPQECAEMKHPGEAEEAACMARNRALANAFQIVAGIPVC